MTQEGFYEPLREKKILTQTTEGSFLLYLHVILFPEVEVY